VRRGSRGAWRHARHVGMGAAGNTASIHSVEERNWATETYSAYTRTVLCRAVLDEVVKTIVSNPPGGIVVIL
jgi:hypothetical protein